MDLSSDKKERLNLNDSVIHELLEASNDGFWVWNIQTGEVYFSNRWIEMLGYSPEEIAPHVSSWEKLVHPEDMPYVSQVLEAHLKGKCPYYETEHRVKTKSGEWKWILDRGRVIERDEKGSPLKAAGAHTDISERKELEEERKENFRQSEETKQKLIQLNQQLENALEARKKFLSIASHELKTPLSSILLTTQAVKKILEKEISTESKERMSSLINKHEKQVLRLNRLIDEMLDVTRIETKKMSLHLEKFHLKELINDIKEQLNDQVLIATGKNLEVELENDSEVEWDNQRISQVLTNIISNSIKYGQGTPILLKGFERLKSQDGIQGLGIGLFISKEIIKLHHGKIWVESDRGKGTKFCIRLHKTLR